MNLTNWEKNINLKNMENFLLNLKNKNGSFKSCENEESDLRSTYAAVVVINIF